MQFLKWLGEFVGGRMGRDTGPSGVDGDEGYNPATGLPMAGGVDVDGNPYGTDMSGWDDHHGPSGMPDYHGSGWDDHHWGSNCGSDW